MTENIDLAGEQLVTLRRWRVVEVLRKDGGRTRHLWGHDVARDDGCASGSITDFSMETMTATTSSGTRYRLAGLPGYSRKGGAAWKDWCSVNEVVSERDVTNQYMDVDDVSTRQFVALNDSAFSAKPD